MLVAAVSGELSEEAPGVGDEVRPSGPVFRASLAARPVSTAEPGQPLPARLVAATGVEQLWSHQAAAIDLARAGRSVVVATGTASGKSLCYQVPVVDAVSRMLRAGTSLLIFPTKALAHDQLRSLSRMSVEGLVAGAYDGDAGREERTWVRGHANVVLTNPEMLHSGLLPNHERWISFLSRLQYVVLDELHAYRGIFGSHVAHVLRRLRRLANHYGSDPTFICTSATVGQPDRLATALCGVPVDAVTTDGSPGNERLVSIHNPHAEDPGSVRAPGRHEITASVTARLVAGGQKTITFCRSRRSTELIASEVRRRLPSSLRESVLPYRGGYLPEERRSVEEALFAGDLLGVVATSALELGIDIGGLDAVVLDGFPGTVASFWQQAGRAGRAGQRSRIELVAGDDQLDQWCANHPEELLARPPEPVVVNPANPFVADAQLRCAARELPLTATDERYWPEEELGDAVRRLVLDDQLTVHRRGPTAAPRALYAGGGWPTHDVSLRAGAAGQITVRSSDGTAVGTVDRARAGSQVHTGACYLHAGRCWTVTDLDLDAGVAWVEPDDGATYTVARSRTDLTVQEIEARRLLEEDGPSGLEVGRGWVEVRQQVVGYQRKEAGSGRVLAHEDLDLPPSTLRTTAFWYTVDEDLLQRAGVTPDRVPGTLHAVEHAGIGVLPLFAICDRWDVGGVSTARQAELGGAAIVIYDGYEGGAGVAALGFEAAHRHLTATLEVVAGCACRWGCPSCVQSPKCGNGNEPLDKAGARALLEVVLRVCPAVQRSTRIDADARSLIAPTRSPTNATRVAS